MCLLVCSRNGLEIPEEHIRYAFTQNKDGAGLAWADGTGAVWRRKGIFNVDTLIKHYKEDCVGKPHILHLRWATSGAKNEDNCHPFDVGGQWFMAHNGVLHGLPQKKDESDTAAYARYCLTPILNKNPRAIMEDEKFIALVKKTTEFSKLAFINGKGEIKIIWEEKGEEKDGIWYSNKMYQPIEQRYPDYRNYNSQPNQHWINRQGYRWDGSAGAWVPIVPPAPNSITTPTPDLKLLPPPRADDDSERFSPIPSHAIQCCESCDKQFGDQQSWFDSDHEDVICPTCKEERVKEDADDVAFRDRENMAKAVQKFLGATFVGKADHDDKEEETPERPIKMDMAPAPVEV